jgi:hypothetical protein
MGQFLFLLVGGFKCNIGGLQVFHQALRPLRGKGGAALEQDKHQNKEHAGQEFGGGLDHLIIRFPILLEPILQFGNF